MENDDARDNEDNEYELCDACAEGNMEVVEDILSNKDVDINVVYGGSTPLMWAVLNDNIDIVRRLLEHPGIQLGKTDRHGNNTALHNHGKVF